MSILCTVLIDIKMTSNFFKFAWFIQACCSAYLSSHQTASDANYWTIRTLFIAMATSWLEESAPALEFLVISSNSCPRNLLLVRIHEA